MTKPKVSKPHGRTEWIPVEYENHLAEERQNLGYSIAEFISLAGIKSRGSYREVELGTSSPIYTNGSGRNVIKNDIQLACDFLGIPFEDLFPREVCKLVDRYKDTEPLVASQMYGITQASSFESLEDVDTNFDIQVLLKMVRPRPLSDRVDTLALVKSFMNGATFVEMGVEFNISTVYARYLFWMCIRQIRSECLVQRIDYFRRSVRQPNEEMEDMDIY